MNNTKIGCQLKSTPCYLHLRTDLRRQQADHCLIKPPMTRTTEAIFFLNTSLFDTPVITRLRTKRDLPYQRMWKLCYICIRDHWYIPKPVQVRNFVCQTWHTKKLFLTVAKMWRTFFEETNRDSSLEFSLAVISYDRQNLLFLCEISSFYQ